MRTVDLLLHGASQVVTMAGGRKGPRAGTRAMNDVRVVEDGAVAIHRGRVVGVGRSNDVAGRFRAYRRVFCRDRTILPGLVDAHTHPVFARMRENEFAMRCRGATYEEIFAAGGGIHASAEVLQDASEEELARGVRKRLDRMLLHGTTVAEAKSGYGLTTESELKSLRALARGARGHPVRVVPTFLGAHAMPPRYRGNRRAYVREVIEEMIPRVAKRKLAVFCDVFVEDGAFTVAEGRKILEAGLAHGLRPKVHADEFRDGGGARLAAAVGAISAEHLGATKARGIREMARAGVIPVLLPATCVFLGLDRPNARGMIEAGCAVALATDFNPGSSPTENLHLVAALGCSDLGLTPEEALTAITRNAAAAAGVEDAYGRIAVGRRANLLILDAPTYTHLPYRMGTNLTHMVIVDGKIVAERGRLKRK
ncbi:MAG: imidazolonepropionase [Planctomycetota bacterium]